MGMQSARADQKEQEIDVNLITPFVSHDHYSPNCALFLFNANCQFDVCLKKCNVCLIIIILHKYYILFN